MSYTTDKVESMLANDPEDMTRHELGLALYHIGAHTELSRDFTVDFVNRVTLRASQLLYNAIDWSKVNPCSEVSMDGANERMEADWSIAGDEQDWSVVWIDEIPVVPEPQRHQKYKDGTLRQGINIDAVPECACDGCIDARLKWLRHS
jgi:hypothetical protein